MLVLPLRFIRAQYLKVMEEPMREQLSVSSLSTNFPKMAEFSSPGTPSSRHEKSLGLLTTKFVNLLQEAKDGVLDLKMVRSVESPNSPAQMFSPSSL